MSTAGRAGLDHQRVPHPPGEPVPPCVTVGGVAISEAEIAREMQFHPAVTLAQSRAAAARALIVRELLRLEVRRLGMAGQVRSVGHETQEEANIRELLEREIDDRVPDEDDCRRYYEKNRELFRSPRRIRVRHILLGAAADDVEGRLNARSQGERLIRELKASPMLFADLAMRRSDCPSKERGGDLGWLQRGQTTPELDRQIFNLPPGLAAFPVESRWGYHIVNIDEIRAGAPLRFDEVRAQISDYLELQRRQCEVQLYLLRLQERYGVHDGGGALSP